MNADALVRYLDDNEIDIFDISQLAADVGYPASSIQSYIETLARRGIINRIAKGKYCRHNFRNEYAIANFLAPDGAIAYWSALNLHGLTSQFSNTIFVQTPKSKRNKTVFGVNYHFVNVQPNKATGYEMSGTGNHAFKITGLEKTIVDCFDLPQYSGGYAELLIALKIAKLNNTKLIEACKAVNNISIIKRLGYLITLYKKPGMQSFINYASDSVNERYSLIDPLGKNKGTFNNEWKIRLNLPVKQILAIGESHY